MRSLNYNIYQNINEDDYFFIEDKLIVIEEEMNALLKGIGWHLRSVKNTDGLAIDFTSKQSDFYGNMGILFDDNPRIKTFTFFVTKSFDEGFIRYFLPADIFKNKELDFFEKNVSRFVFEALEIYKKWTRADIIRLGTRVELGH